MAPDGQMSRGWTSDRVLEGVVRGAFLGFLVVAIALRLWLERRWLRSVAQHILRQLCFCPGRQAPGDHLEARVQERCRERRLHRARIFAILVNIRFLVKEVSWLLGILSGEPTVAMLELVLQHAVAASTVLVSLFPCIITFKTIHALYIMNMCGMILANLASEEAGAPMTTIAPAFFWCLFDLLPWLNVFWLTVHVIAVTFKMWLTSEPGDYYEWWSAYINCCLTILWLDYIITSGIRLELLAQDSGNELGAVKRLLGSICDVVVELDKNLCLTHHSARLSDILLYASGRSLQGLAMEEFIQSEDDRKDFALRLQSSSEETSADTDVFHTRFRDSSGSNIAMELFSVPFQGPDTHRHHILGMREFTDIHPLTPSPEIVHPPRGAKLRPDWVPPETCPVSSAPSHTASYASSESSERGSLQMETVDVAKKLTIASTLMGWSISGPAGACCPWHMLLGESSRVISAMQSGRCQPEFGPIGRWQCRHCGIAAVEYRDRTLKHCCSLCKDVGSLAPQQGNRTLREVRAL